MCKIKEISKSLKGKIWVNFFFLFFFEVSILKVLFKHCKIENVKVCMFSSMKRFRFRRAWIFENFSNCKILNEDLLNLKFSRKLAFQVESKNVWGKKGHKANWRFFIFYSMHSQTVNIIWTKNCFFQFILHCTFHFFSSLNFFLFLVFLFFSFMNFFF